jgi:hypothetical protein
VALLFLTLVLVLPVLVLFGIAFTAAISLRRANRVLPTGRSGTAPPLPWLWSPGAAAVLHRRLRSACEVASSVGNPRALSKKPRKARGGLEDDGIAGLAREVLQEALLVDRQVVSASRLARGPARNQALLSLDQQVRGLEDAAARIRQMAMTREQLAYLPKPAELSLEQRISAMEAALHELTPPPPET